MTISEVFRKKGEYGIDVLFVVLKERKKQSRRTEDKMKLSIMWREKGRNKMEAEKKENE